MATQEPGQQQPSLTALPRLEDIQRKSDGFDPDGVREAFEAFRRHSAQLQAQLRVLQAASRSGQTVEPTGHAVRMDSLHLIRAAAEFADTVEAGAQAAAILSRAQSGTEQLLAAAGLGEEEIKRVGEAIVEAARESIEATRTPPAAARPAAAVAAAPPVSRPPAAAPSTEEEPAD